MFKLGDKFTGCDLVSLAIHLEDMIMQSWKQRPCKLWGVEMYLKAIFKNAYRYTRKSRSIELRNAYGGHYCPSLEIHLEVMIMPTCQLWSCELRNVVGYTDPETMDLHRNPIDWEAVDENGGTTGPDILLIDKLVLMGMYRVEFNKLLQEMRDKRW